MTAFASRADPHVADRRDSNCSAATRSLSMWYRFSISSAMSSTVSRTVTSGHASFLPAQKVPASQEKSKRPRPPAERFNDLSNRNAKTNIQTAAMVDAQIALPQRTHDRFQRSLFN